MGSWSVNCGISNIAITSGNKCVLLPIKEARSEERKYQPATLPIFGEYDDYGGIENIEKNENTELIEKHFCISIEEFCQFFIDGKFTYDRDESKDIARKIENIDEIKEWRFMWIDRKVYDFMITGLDEYNKGYNDYGTPEMLTLLGFVQVDKPKKITNYDPKRFNQVWKKGRRQIYSDGNTILTNKNEYVYHFGKGDNSSIETYFEVPRELNYIKEKQKHETWRLIGNKAKKQLGWILGNRLDFDIDDDLEEMINRLREKKLLNNEIPLPKEVKSKPLYKQYCDNLEVYGDRLAELINLSHNLHPMSGQFTPHVLYLTPQCGEYKQHQIILEKFSEINKTYINNEE